MSAQDIYRHGFDHGYEDAIKGHKNKPRPELAAALGIPDYQDQYEFGYREGYHRGRSDREFLLTRKPEQQIQPLERDDV